MFRRRHARVALVLISALSFISTGLFGPTRPAGASESSDQSSITQLEQQIAAQGAQAQALVERYNEVQARMPRRAQPADLA